MLKNIKQEELNNRSANSENIEDSQSFDENNIEPLCSFDISLNNGKKATLIINEGDNYEQKVNNFCHTYKISPQDGQVLLKRVKEEIEMYPNIDNYNIDNNNNNNVKYNNEINPEPQSGLEKLQNLFLGNKDYIPKEKKKLDHILNESESFSISESVNQSQNKSNNTKKDYVNNNLIQIPNNNKNKTTINNKINIYVQRLR